MPALDQFCTVPSPSAWSLASDWSRHITWPEYWPLIGCRRHYVTCVPCLISPGSPPIITAPWPLRRGGGAEAIQEANSGLTRHCWKQQILADIKLTVSKLTRFHSTGSFYKPRDQITNIALIFLLVLLNVNLTGSYLIWHLLLLMDSRLWMTPPISMLTETASSRWASAAAPCCSSPSPTPRGRPDPGGEQTSSSQQASPFIRDCFSVYLIQMASLPRDGGRRWRSSRPRWPPPPRCCGMSGDSVCRWHPMMAAPDHGGSPGAAARPPPPRCSRRCCPACCCRGQGRYIEPRHGENAINIRKFVLNHQSRNIWKKGTRCSTQFLVTFLNFPFIGKLN